MSCMTILLCATSLLYAGLLRLVACLPVTEISVEKLHQKRWEAGPQMGGVNFPDPCIIQVDNTWYSFATRTIGSSVHIQIAESDDFTSWNMVYNEDGSQRDALPDLPPWVYAASPNTWAPDVSQMDNGRFIMYYSATTTYDITKHCVGAATSWNIEGPYTPEEGPLFCPLPDGGAIDAAGFNDSGQRYVVYKVDGNSIGHGGLCSNTVPPIVPTPIILQAMEQDGLTPQGNPTILLNNRGIPDGGSVEAPCITHTDGTYVLFFSSGCYVTTNYTVNYATASSITGPYQRAEHPLFVTGDYGLVAPGGMSIYHDGMHLLFHANFDGGRALYNAVVAVSNERVTA